MLASLQVLGVRHSESTSSRYQMEATVFVSSRYLYCWMRLSVDKLNNILFPDDKLQTHMPLAVWQVSTDSRLHLLRSWLSLCIFLMETKMLATTVQLSGRLTWGHSQTCGPTQFCTSVTPPNYLNAKLGLKSVYHIPLQEYTYDSISGNKIEPFNVLFNYGTWNESWGPNCALEPLTE
jgi:hypothetical protein